MGILNFSYERYIDESYFAVLGITGVGKSSFLNALMRENICEVGNQGNSKTKLAQIINFIHNEHQFFAIDTPGLDDDDDNDDDDENVRTIEKIIEKSPKIKAILIIMPYNQIRLTRSLRKAIIVFMKLLPVSDFWNHVFIIYSWANPNDNNFVNYLHNNPVNFKEKLMGNKKIVEFMNSKNINPPSTLEEFFIDSVTGKNMPNVEAEFTKIKNKIYETEFMFPSVRRGEVETEIIPSVNKGFFKIEKYQIVIITDYDNKVRKLKQLLEEKEEKPTNADIVKTETLKILDHEDDVKWYDILSIGISWLVRKTKLYKIYEVTTYRICGQEVKGERIFKKNVWE